MTKTTVPQNEADCKTLIEALGRLDASEIVRMCGEMLINALMSAEADAICGVPYGVKDPDNRMNSRNGYRHKPLETTAGTLALDIPKLRKGSYFPEWFCERTKRSDAALWAAVAEIYVNGVSTRKVDKVIKTLGIEGISSSQVSRLSSVLDEEVAAFRDRRLEGPFPFLWLDATYLKCRLAGRVVSVALFVATCVDAEGKRLIAGLSLYPQETYEAWREFLSGLKDRGLSGVVLTISDAHEGLKKAIGEVFSNSSWQRCRTHLSRDICAHIPKAHKSEVGRILDRVFTQDDPGITRNAYHSAIDELARISEKAANILEEAEDDALAYLAHPRELWKKIQSNNSQERLNLDIKRRTRVVGAFPSEASVIRLVGSLLQEIDLDWQSRAYIAKTRIEEAIESAADDVGYDASIITYVVEPPGLEAAA